MLVDTNEPRTIDVSRLVDDQKISRFLISIILLGFVAQMGDGYDLAAAAYAAVGITHSWHIDRATLGPMFSASLFGMMFGAPLFGYMGDRFGRRGAIIISCVVTGVFSLGAIGAHSLLELCVLRFFTGIGLGGLPANTIPIMAEYAPARSRATLITLMFMGITLGGTLPAAVTAMAPEASWHLLFEVGAAIPLVAALLNFLFLPESFKFLALRDSDNPKVIQLARRMRPDLLIPDRSRFLFAHKTDARFSFKFLFAGKLRWITPLAWVLMVTNLMANFFLNSWMPTLLHGAGLSASQSAITASMYYFGGIVGGLTISRSLDRSGIGIVALFMLLGCPAVMLMGSATGFSPLMLKFVLFMVGVTVLGNQLGLNAVIGLIYPTAIRANGSGWALGIGRFGAILGPLIGGQLIGAHLSLQILFLAPVVPLAIGALAAMLLRPMVRDRFAGKGELTMSLTH